MRSSPGRLILRADAGPTIGAGHVMRCLAIAQAWQRLGGSAIFVANELSDALQARLDDMRATIEQLGPLDETADAERTVAIATATEARWIVVDSYQLGEQYHRTLTGSGLHVLSLNDFQPTAAADVVLNSNPQASVASYPELEEQTMLLLGPRYCLLRDEFAGPPSPRPPAGAARRLLVAAGGADPTGLTLAALAALQKIRHRDLEATVMVGAANPNRTSIEAAAAALPCPVRVLFDCRDVLAELQRADVAVTAAGSSCWEMAYAGLPMLAMATADNQIPVAAAIAAAGAGVDLGLHRSLTAAMLTDPITQLLELNPAQRQAMSQAGQQLVDGAGAERVAALMATPSIRFRRATMHDARLLWTWRNDPTVRSVSLSGDEQIPYDSHCGWLQQRLQQSDCRLMLALDAQGTACGQVRFDDLGTDAQAVISISLARECRSRGLGTAIIRHATEYVLGRRLAAGVDAFIKRENQASINAFAKSGYQLAHQPADPCQPLRYTSGASFHRQLSPQRAIA